MGFIDKMIRNELARREQQPGPEVRLQDARWAVQQPAPETEETDPFLDRTDPANARRVEVGSDFIHVQQPTHRSWDTNSQAAQHGNEFGLSQRDQVKLNKQIAKGRFNNEGTDVIGARERAAQVHALQRQGVFDSDQNQRYPQTFA